MTEKQHPPRTSGTPMAANETKVNICEAPAGLFVFMIVFIETIVSILVTPVSTGEALIAILNPEKGKRKSKFFIPGLKLPIIKSRTVMGEVGTGIKYPIASAGNTTGFILKTKMTIPGLKFRIPVSVLAISNLMMPVPDLK